MAYCVSHWSELDLDVRHDFVQVHHVVAFPVFLALVQTRYWLILIVHIVQINDRVCFDIGDRVSLSLAQLHSTLTWLLPRYYCCCYCGCFVLDEQHWCKEKKTL